MAKKFHKSWRGIAYMLAILMVLSILTITPFGAFANYESSHEDELTPSGITMYPLASSPEFYALREVALAAIVAAGLPDATQFINEGYSVVVPGQEITQRSLLTNCPNDPNRRYKETDPKMKPFTYWPELGVPVISGIWGSAPSTGIYGLIDAALALNTAWDIENDLDFVVFNEFAKLHSPAATAGTVAYTKVVNIVSVHLDTVLAQSADPDPSFESHLDYRILTAAIEVGVAPIDYLRVALLVPNAGFPGGPGQPGFSPYDGLRAQVFTLDFNHQGVVIGFDHIITDNVQHIAVTDGGQSIRIGDYLNTLYPITPGASIYLLEGPAAAPIITPIANIEAWYNTLTVAQKQGSSIRAVFNSDRTQIIEAYITLGNRPNLPGNIAQVRRFEYRFGVQPDDPIFEFDARENPFPVDYMLFNPINFPAETGATDPTGLYPLVIFFHGHMGDGNKNSVQGTAMMYATEAFQRQFENANPELSGAFIMNGRASGRASHTLAGQGWLHGARYYTNPLWREYGDLEARYRPTQTAAMVRNIQRLIANYPIDPDRVYITGQSAGSYMSFSTLLRAADMGYANLFAAALVANPAFFPHSDVYVASRPGMDFSQFFPGGNFLDRLYAVRYVPIWLEHAINDATTRFYDTVAVPFPRTYNIGETNTLLDVIEHFRQVYNPLSRSTIQNLKRNNAGAVAGQHSETFMPTNNQFNPGIFVDGVELDFHARIYGERPENWNQGARRALPAYPATQLPTHSDNSLPNISHKGAPAQGVVPTEPIYSFGLSSTYGTPEPWANTFVEWLNSAGRAKSANPGVPVIAISTQPAARTVVESDGTITSNIDSIDGYLVVRAIVANADAMLSYQWYRTDAARTSSTAISGATDSKFAISTLGAGTHHLYVVVSAPMADSVASNIAEVTIPAVLDPPVDPPGGSGNWTGGGGGWATGTTQAVEEEEELEDELLPLVEWEDYANMLYTLGLFRGVGVDTDGNPIFAPEDRLNRIQALVLTLRLLGLENDVYAFEGENPFEDAAGWQVPYISYAYAHGITRGVSATRFAPSDYVTFQQFTTFLLRSLGYNDNGDGDFTFAIALEKSLAIGMYTQIVFNELNVEEFTRGNAVTAMISALLTNIRGAEDMTLLDSLVADEVIKPEAMEAFIYEMSNFRHMGDNIDT